jgi:hypothetical protein
MSTNPAIRRIITNYTNACNSPSDIFEHLPTLYELTTQCEEVAEMGVRGVVSTWAFLNGLSNNNSSKKILHCVDIEPIPNASLICHIAQSAEITMKVYEEDSAKVILPPVDLLFIDTFHVYAHLKRELAHHHANVRKYIVMHDTVADAFHGEVVRCNLNVFELWQKTGYSVEEMTKGLAQAIQEFLAAHPEWKIKSHYSNNNGLTVLERV